MNKLLTSVKLKLDVPTDDPPKISLKTSSKIVFISRAETYFGRILTQHFAHASISTTSRVLESDAANNELFDLSFLDLDGKSGTDFKVFGTFRPERSLDPYEPTKRPPKTPGAVGMCPADNLGHMVKIMTAADICLFHTADDDGMNEVLDDTAQAFELMTKVALDSKTPKVLVLVSTAMTWAKTKETGAGSKFRSIVATEDQRRVGNLEEEVPWLGFCEDEFRRRKPHLNFRRHLELERKFLKLGADTNSLITTVVIAAGVVYGYGENIFHSMFREAWLNTTAVSIISSGAVHIPTIHARDLCQIVQTACLTPLRSPYILAVDDGRPTLQQIAEAISQTLSDGATVVREPDEVLMSSQITSVQYDIFTTDLCLEATTARDSFSFRWISQGGFLSALPRLVEEYKILRNLYPLKLAVFGPPYSGKTTLAKSLSRDYKLPYVDVKAIVQKGIAELEGIQENREKNSGRIMDHYVMQFVRKFLNGVQCQNQGFVLDGYPESYAVAKDLFASRSHMLNGHTEAESKQQQEPVVTFTPHDHSISPDYVIFLDAPEDFLKQRILSQPYNPPSQREQPIEVSVVQRFAEYNFLSTDEDNVLTYFDEVEIPVYTIDITQDDSEKMEKTIHAAMKHIGRPHNYSFSKEEKLTLLRQEAERKIFQTDKNIQQKTFQSKLEQRDKNRRCAQWKAELEKIYNEEKEVKKERPILMKQYLTTFIFPALIDGLTECVTARPADPVDFLAEYLLKNSRPLYLEQSVPFSKMTAQIMKQRKKQLGKINFKKN